MVLTVTNDGSGCICLRDYVCKGRDRVESPRSRGGSVSVWVVTEVTFWSVKLVERRTVPTFILVVAVVFPLTQNE